jgi:pyruvate-formate lyase-activating enzyme
MGVYHITYAPELSEICLYLDGGCQFSCHGCITDWHPMDCHLKKDIHATGQQSRGDLSIDEVISYLKPLSFKKAIFLGKEPTQDMDFLPLAKILKENFFTYNILLTNGWQFIEDKVLDEVCVSIKAISKKIFKDFTGKDNPQQVLDNFKRYVGLSHIKVRVESIFIPGFIDIYEIEKIAKFIAKVDRNIAYRIDAYIPNSRNDKFRRPTKEEMQATKKIANRYLKNVSILHYGVKVKYKVERIY